MKNNEEKYHKTLAEYFNCMPLYLDEKEVDKPNIRKLLELPWQQKKTEKWEEVTLTLCDVFFIEARAKSGLLDLQQVDYDEVLPHIPDLENKNCMDDFHSLFMQQKHILREHPELTFQQLYNELQWKKGKSKDFVEDAKNRFLLKGRFFLHQFREPDIVESQLLMTISAHSSVNCCAISPDGKQIVSGGGYSSKGVLQLWNSETGKEIASLFGHTLGVISCAFSPDGKKIVSGAGDWKENKGEIKLWNAESHKEILSLIGHTCTVTSCAFSPDGKRIISCDCDNSPLADPKLKLWNTETGQEIASYRGDMKSVTINNFSPDGKRFVSGYQGETLKLWDSETGKEIITLSKHCGHIKSCAFSPDGKHIVSGGGYSDEGELILWNAETGEEIKTLSKYKNIVTFCAFSPNGKRIVSACKGDFLKLWDAENGKEIASLSEYARTFLAFSPDGKQIASSYYDTLKILDSENGEELSSLNGHGGLILSCVFSPDGKQIVSCSQDFTLKLWNTEIKKKTTSLKGHRLGIKYCAFSPNGKRIITTDPYETKIWDTGTGKEIVKLNGNSREVTSYSFSPDGKQIITASDDSTLKLWDTETGMEIFTLLGHRMAVCTCAFSPDGKLIVSGSADKTIKLWDAKTGKEIMSLNEHASWVVSCAFSPDGRKIISISDNNITIIWDVKAMREKTVLNMFMYYEPPLHLPLRQAHSRSFCQIFSPDGKRIISRYGYNSLKLWNAEVEIASFIGHSGESNSFAFSPDNRRIVSGNFQTIKFWDAVTGKEIETLLGQGQQICIFAPDGKRIVSGNHDWVLKIWDVTTSKEITEYYAEANIETCMFCSDGTTLVCGDYLGNLYFLKLIGFEIGTPIITGARLWLNSNGGVWDNNITATCPYCGVRFPCLIPKDATFDDPRLLQKCPECGKQMKFNPFVVDNKEKWD